MGCGTWFSFGEKEEIAGRAQEDGKVFRKPVFQGWVEFQQESMIDCVRGVVNKSR